MTTRIITRLISTLSLTWGPETVRSSVLNNIVSVASNTGANFSNFPPLSK